MTVTDASWKSGDAARLIRRILLALVLLGIVGLIVELFLLEHTESFLQWIPFGVLVVGLAASAVLAARPTRGAVLTFRAVMVIFVVAGVLGLVLHFRGNIQFERENDPSLRGLDLVWRALRGATPTLAPGALAQLGLMGIAGTIRHPALRRRATSDVAPGVGTQPQETP